jgi:hypothetical protein
MVLAYIILPFIKIKGDLGGDLREIVGKIRGDLREIVVVVRH